MNDVQLLAEAYQKICENRDIDSGIRKVKELATEPEEVCVVKMMSHYFWNAADAPEVADLGVVTSWLIGMTDPGDDGDVVGYFGMHTNGYNDTVAALQEFRFSGSTLGGILFQIEKGAKSLLQKIKEQHSDDPDVFSTLL